ncbi:hypothetical protein MSAN_02144600 [Mycena sanguinolenta]|uniref:Uncharacterized protein n=1 Tax=Mycena sanguinolenta TaxID=230812 RepID=A0A8H7CJ18_9AGAR|nr:hypothetical protein MSAN_02144600 [Mycena sanguinolenta]
MRNEKLTLGYMHANQPFDILPEEYFACGMPDNANPPWFVYGFAFPLSNSIGASVEMLQAMHRNVPTKFHEGNSVIDAICKYVESQVDANFEFEIRRAPVDCHPKIIFVFRICSSWMPRRPKTPEWVPVLAGVVAEIFEDLGWKAPQPKWYLHRNMSAYDDSRDFNNYPGL